VLKTKNLRDFAFLPILRIRSKAWVETRIEHVAQHWPKAGSITDDGNSTIPTCYGLARNVDELWRQQKDPMDRCQLLWTLPEALNAGFD
jgi:hypothetical protein